jgi:GTP-binding protein
MIIRSAEFVKSCVKLEDCPKADKPEYAFIGRSNVGKSSLINMITGKSKLAKTSSTPGKTQTINHFIINEEWFLADLPGVGYAKVSQVQREKWSKMINNFLLNRENLMNIFYLVDSRLPMQEIDRQSINFFGLHGLPFTIIMTKTDKLTKGALAKNMEAYKKCLAEDWDPLPVTIITSAEKFVGRDEIFKIIEDSNPLYKKP